MREIKFRGKSIKTGEMVYGYAVSPMIYSCPIEPNVEYIFVVSTELKEGKGGGWIAVDMSTVGQYTGLLDKNGVEIYEGDVFFCNQCGENRVVEWMNEYAMFTFHRLRVHDGYEVDNEEIEVIGNIHENPELLTP